MSKPKSVVQGVSHPRENNFGQGVSHLTPAKRSINLRLPATEAAAIEQAARETGRSLAGFIRYAALQMLSSLEDENKNLSRVYPTSNNEQIGRNR